jgi:hypothetical protein
VDYADLLGDPSARVWVALASWNGGRLAYEWG